MSAYFKFTIIIMEIVSTAARLEGTLIHLFNKYFLNIYSASTVIGSHDFHVVYFQWYFRFSKSCYFKSHDQVRKIFVFLAWFKGRALGDTEPQVDGQAPDNWHILANVWDSEVSCVNIA